MKWRAYRDNFCMSSLCMCSEFQLLIDCLTYWLSNPLLNYIAVVEIFSLGLIHSLLDQLFPLIEWEGGGDENKCLIRGSVCVAHQGELVAPYIWPLHSVLLTTVSQAGQVSTHPPLIPPTPTPTLTWSPHTTNLTSALLHHTVHVSSVPLFYWISIVHLVCFCCLAGLFHLCM